MEYAYYVLPGIDLYFSKVSIYRYCFDIEGYRKIDSDIVSKRIALSFTTLISIHTGRHYHLAMGRGALRKLLR